MPESPSLQGLNPEQKTAVLHERGPLLVLAGAGSGKTRVITNRLARLVETGADPRTIVAVTFTNKAADEMRERAKRLLGGRPLVSFVGTFHSWALRFLRRHAALAGLPPRFSIADSAEQLALVKEAMEELGVSEQVLPPGAVRSRISHAKNALVSAQAFADSQTDYAGERIGRVFLLYEKKLAVADEDQAIYRWRGAEVEHILRFDQDFPGARIVPLERNYRSTSGILDAASGLVANNRRRRPKRLIADRGAGARIRLWRFDEDRSEAEAVARAVEERRGEVGGVAILYRTNAHSRSFEEELVRRRLPYDMVVGMKFYERAEVKDALAYLRLAARPEDDLAFRRVVNVPARGIGQATLDRIGRAVRESGKSWWEVSANPPPELADRARTALSRFRALVSELSDRAQSEPPSALLEHLLESTGYAALYDASSEPEDVARRENLAELVSAAREFERRSGEDATLAEYLDSVVLATDAEAARGGRGVTLSTLHAAKGLEFPAVFVVGLEEGYLPHGQSGKEEDELEEERRLLYVGMTRAKDELTLTLARRRWGC